MNDELDELPGPPQGNEALSIDDTIDAGLLTDVPKMGESLPAGTYVFRLEKFTSQWTQEEFETGRKLEDHEKQPQFNLQWRCQQEPFVGRVVFEIVPWVRAEDARAANDSQNPRRGEARQAINKALPRAKQIMEAASFSPSGQFGFKEFLSSNPEMKLQINVKEKMQKSPEGKWVGSGEFTNKVQKHLRMSRPV